MDLTLDMSWTGVHHTTPFQNKKSVTVRKKSLDVVVWREASSPSLIIRDKTHHSWCQTLRKSAILGRLRSRHSIGPTLRFWDVFTGISL
jgi:hypothetical protein